MPSAPSSASARRATLAQVAARAGVSVMTASYAYSRPGRVSEQARAKVFAAATELGYAGPDPRARSLRRGTTRTLGVVLGERLSYAFDDPAAVAFLAGVAEVCADRGFGVTILPTTGAAEDVERVREAAVDGFVVWTTADDDPVLGAVAAMGRPAVLHGGSPVAGLASVGVEEQVAAREIGRVVFTGARRPAIVSQPLDRARESRVVRAEEIVIDEVLFPVTRERLAGFRAAIEDLGVPWASVVVAVCSVNDAAEAERLAAGLLAGDDPPDAIAAMSDQQAAGVLAAARVSGRRVPDDVAVTGWDDVPVAAALDLTTVVQSLRAQGAACARLALGEQVEDARADWAVVRRGSTRPA